jgi:hypothetical protein
MKGLTIAIIVTSVILVIAVIVVVLYFTVLKPKSSTTCGTTGLAAAVVVGSQYTDISTTKMKQQCPAMTTAANANCPANSTTPCFTFIPYFCSNAGFADFCANNPTDTKCTQTHATRAPYTDFSCTLIYA